MASRVPTYLEVTGRVRIPGTELHLSYAASSGPGGQNVNKVASKALLRWNPGDSAALTEEDRAFLLSRIGSRLTTNGDLLLSSDRNRDQPRNVEDVLERLRDLLRTALLRPRRRTKTRPTRSSKERRLRSKRERSATKTGRRRVGDDRGG